MATEGSTLRDESTTDTGVMTLALDEETTGGAGGGRRHRHRASRKFVLSSKVVAMAAATALCAGATAGIVAIKSAGGSDTLSLASDSSNQAGTDTWHRRRPGGTASGTRTWRPRRTHPARTLPATAPAGTTTTGTSSTAPSSTTSASSTTTRPPSSTTTPAPAPTSTSTRPPGTTGFPDASNTGVPDGVTLGTYSGPCTVTSNITIDAKTIRCSYFRVNSGTLTITRSKLLGRIDAVNSGKVVVIDTEIDSLNQDGPAVGFGNATVLRANIYNAQHGVLCEDSCDVRDSYIHLESIPSGSARHMQAFLSNGGTDATLVHNTLSCDVPITSSDGGCTADVAIFGDFSPNHRYTFDNNLFMPSTRLSYCAYGGTDPKKPYGTDVSNIVFRNNVFQKGSNGKCGLYGAVTSFDTGAPGNVWTNNVFTDGTPVRP
jgi:hypothetical protein